MSKKTWRKQRWEALTPTIMRKKNDMQAERESESVIPMHLTNKKIAYLSMPKEVTVKDIKIINHALENILLRINLERQESPSTQMTAPPKVEL